MVREPQPSLAEIPDYPFLLDYVDHYAKRTPRVEAAADLNGRRLNYADLRTEVAAMMQALANAGCQPGDRVALLAPPSVDFWVAFLAIVGAGCVFTGLNPRYTSPEILTAVRRADARLVLAADEFAAGALPARDSGAMVLPYPPGGMLAALARASRRGRGASLPVASRDPDAASLLVFTSGSTGAPKGAMLSQTGLVQCSRVQATHYCGFGERGYNCLPINHVGAVCDTATTLLVAGGTQVFAPFAPDLLWANLARERISTIGGVPTMLQMLFADAGQYPPDLHAVRRIVWSGAMLPRQLGEQLAALGKPMLSFYGMTETTGSVTFTGPEATLETLLTTIGLPDPQYRVRIADPHTGAPCQIGEVGEIQVRSPGVLLEYLNDAEATRNAFTPDGWFRTGDLAAARADGYLSLSGRLKDMFKSGGYNVYPREIELVIETMPGVATACVVAVPDVLFGEVGFAFVVPAGATPVDREQVLRFLSNRLANFKRPKHVAVLEDPPVLANGKLDRRALAGLARACVPGE